MESDLSIIVRQPTMKYQSPLEIICTKPLRLGSIAFNEGIRIWDRSLVSPVRDKNRSGAVVSEEPDSKGES